VKDSATDPRKNTSASWVQSPGGGERERARESKRERERARERERERERRPQERRDLGI